MIIIIIKIIIIIIIIIILTILIITIVKIVTVIVIIISVVIMKIIIMAIKIIIIVIKITITVIMKITMVLKLMKIFVLSHNPKTYISSNSDNAQQKVQKNFLSPNIAAPSAMQEGYEKQRPSHTFFNIKTKGSHCFQGTSPVIFSFKRIRWISFVCY